MKPCTGGDTHEGCPGLPNWCDHRVRFFLHGQAYEIVAMGSDNFRAPQHDRFECNVVAAPIDDPWTMPKEGTPVREVSQAFTRMRGLPCFHADELAFAVYIVTTERKAARP